jgi:hypothetical protein
MRKFLATLALSVLASTAALAATPVPNYTDARGSCTAFLMAPYAHMRPDLKPDAPDPASLRGCIEGEEGIRDMLTAQWAYYSERGKEVCTVTSQTYRDLSNCIYIMR